MLMFIYLFPLLTFSWYPRTSLIFVGPNYSQENVDNANDAVANKETICKEEQDYWESYSDCIDYYNSVNKVHYSSGSDINEILKKVDSSTEFLTIQGSNFGEIDFNNLNGNMVVDIEPPDEEYSSGQSFTKMNKNRREYVNKNFFGKTHKRVSQGHKRSNSEVISINGDMKKSVSFLQLNNINVKFVKNELNVFAVKFYDSILSPDTTNIRTTFLVDDEYTFYSNNADIINNDKIIQVNQYTFISYQSPNEITYTKDSWQIGEYALPYKRATVVNLIVTDGSITIARLVEDPILESYQDINLTIAGEDFGNAKQLEDEEKTIFTIKSVGWENVDKEKRPDVRIEYDSSSYEIVLDENFELQTSKGSLYSYQRPSDKNKGLSPGAIAGIVIACVVVVAVVVVVVVIVVRKKNGVANSASQ